jgi:MFS family permease
MHLDILKWDHPTAWAWLIVYIVSPIGAIWVGVTEERRWRVESEEGRRMAPALRLLFGVFGTASAAIGVALFIAPTHVGDVWPWTLTPLTGRVIGGWYLSGAALQLMLSRTRSVATARVGLLATIAVTALQLLGALLNHDHFTGPAWAVALYLSYSVILGVTALAASLPTHQKDVAVAA